MSTEIEILTKAYNIEYGPKAGDPHFTAWESYQVGASRSDINHLKEQQLIRISSKFNAGVNSLNKYRLTEKGTKLVKSVMEDSRVVIDKEDVLEAMNLIVGFDDVKDRIAKAVEARARTHFLLQGPPACAKSLILEAVHTAVGAEHSYLAFGSRTSGAGLSDQLFNQRPVVLLLDEADKMDKDTRSVLLGLLETGDIIETKSRKTRGLKLNCQVLAACNKSDKFTPEFISRFAAHLHFPQYTRDEFLDVCVGFLSRAENAPPDIARLIGLMVFDNNLGDVRKARGVWKLMNEPTEDEVFNTIKFMVDYSPNANPKRNRQQIQQVML
jgi:hypothetical protein